LIVRLRNGATRHHDEPMLSFPETAIPALIGGGSVMVIRHFARALFASAPVGTDTCSLTHVSTTRRHYYRTPLSALPTLLLIAGIVLSASLPSLLWLDRPFETIEGPLLVGLVCGFTFWMGGRLDERLWQRYLASTPRPVRGAP
jgi:hypothetical protein